MGPGLDNSSWEPFLTKVVIVDTSSSYLYIGTLSSVGDHFIVLRDVDVHDRAETPTTKEKYVLEARRFGVKPNRKEVSVRKAVIMSLSLLDDVIEY